MDRFSIYDDINLRTGGEVYMAVVGPVRTGKSTFVRRFSELLILPNANENQVAEVLDQLPVSGSGTTITTVEPKFIPKEAVSINVSDEANPKTLRLRLIDCVGYMVEGAKGHLIDGNVRMVKTPWSDTELPFTAAADIGTQKVIYDHSTVAAVITTDGTISDIPRDNYVAAEERTIEALKATGKPYVIILNTLKPYGNEAKKLAGELEDKYAAPVIPINLEHLKEEDVLRIFECLISMFPVEEISFELPDFFFMLDESADVRNEALGLVKDICTKINCMKDISDDYTEYCSDRFNAVALKACRLESGRAEIRIDIDKSIYYSLLGSIMNSVVLDEADFLGQLRILVKKNTEFERMQNAWSDSLIGGYGVVLPVKEEIVLHEPELIKQGNGYGVKIHAVAPCTHFIRTEIETELAPIVGSEAQAKDLFEFIQNNNGSDSLWTMDVFGKSMGKMVEEGIETRIISLNDECRNRLRTTMNRIVNESCNFVCFIL